MKCELYISGNEPTHHFADSGKMIDIGKGHDCSPGRRKIAVKVIDIFSNDTMKIIDVNVGGK